MLSWTDMDETASHLPRETQPVDTQEPACYIMPHGCRGGRNVTTFIEHSPQQPRPY